MGIDIGKRAHHAAAIDTEGNPVWSHRITNDQESIERIVALAMSMSTDVRWAVDMTSHEAALMLGVLNTAGQRVQYVPGRIVHRMTGAFTGEGRTDARDALVIAQTARMRADISQLAPPDEMIVELTVTDRASDRPGGRLDSRSQPATRLIDQYLSGTRAELRLFDSHRVDPAHQVLHTGIDPGCHR